MTAQSSDPSRSSQSRPPSDRVEDLARIQEALAQGVRQALRRHKQAGNPVATWQNGAVVRIAPEDIPMGDSPVDDESKGAG